MRKKKTEKTTEKTSKNLMDLMQEIKTPKNPKKPLKKTPKKAEKPKKELPKKESPKAPKKKAKVSNEKVPMPSCWKEIKRMDLKVFQLTKDLVKYLSKIEETMSQYIETDVDKIYFQDVEDYLAWARDLNSDIAKYKDYGRDRFTDA